MCALDPETPGPCPHGKFIQGLGNPTSLYHLGHLCKDLETPGPYTPWDLCAGTQRLQGPCPPWGVCAGTWRLQNPVPFGASCRGLETLPIPMLSGGPVRPRLLLKGFVSLFVESASLREDNSQSSLGPAAVFLVPGVRSPRHIPQPTCMPHRTTGATPLCRCCEGGGRPGWEAPVQTCSEDSVHLATDTQNPCLGSGLKSFKVGLCPNPGTCWEALTSGVARSAALPGSGS